MATEHRYSDDDVRRIFEVAAMERPVTPLAAAPDGLTLEELQDIGRQVGLAPARIARAAAALRAGGEPLPRRMLLGMPVGVGRVVRLPRTPTDAEWSHLVTSLRETFDARGVDRSEGDLRLWANGNLHAYVEPDDEGMRLRLRTLSSNATAYTTLGLMFLAIALVTVVSFGITGGLDEKRLSGAILLALIGGGALGVNALRLPRWARVREAQMERIGERAVELVAGPPSTASRAAAPAAASTPLLDERAGR